MISKRCVYGQYLPISIPTEREQIYRFAFSQYRHRVDTAQKIGLCPALHNTRARVMAPLSPVQDTLVYLSMTRSSKAYRTPKTPPTDVPPVCITPETLSAVLTRLRHGTAPGVTGWTYAHILDATHRPSARRACIAFLNNMLTGHLPHVPELLDSDGLPLRKPAGGIRPIAIGEAW
jgi:hypothetical protein